MLNPTIILASASLGRANILREANIVFMTDPADIDEDKFTAHSAEELVKTLAYEKATVVVKRHPNAMVIAADTLIVLTENDKEIIIGKPRDATHARAILQRLSGNTHRVITGMCLYQNSLDLQSHKKSPLSVIGSETTYVTFKSLSDHDINEYLAAGEAMGKSGAYGIQGKARALIEKIDGKEDNVVGFPMTLFNKLKREY